MKNKFIFISLLCLLLIFPLSISAESSASLFSMEELSIQVMPEYSYHPKDKQKGQPPLLIGYHGTLMNKSDKVQKGKIEIPLPMNAKGFRIGYVADYNRDQSEMFEIEYEINKQNGTISWTTTEEVQPGELYKFVVEFYTNAIKEKKDAKQLSYSFKSFADSGLVRILFLEPLKAENFRLTPAADSHQENGYGMNLFMYQIQGMKANAAKDIQLEYKRSESKTTVEMMDEMGNKTPQTGVEKKNETLPLGVIVGGIGATTVLLGALLVFILKQRAKRVPSLEAVNLPPEELDNKKKLLRGMLLEGSISEAEYNELLTKLEN